MFDIYYFEHDPRPFFKFAKEIYPGQFKPSLGHLFVKKIEQHNRLLRNYTQNIDTLEMAAQINNVIQCHGSFATATCTVCKFKVNSEFIREQIFNQEIPYCNKCKEAQESKASVQEIVVNETSKIEGTRQDDEDDDDSSDKDFMPKFQSSSAAGAGEMFF
jgi:NAD-dependent deacetylase sirtuin 1